MSSKSKPSKSKPSKSTPSKSTPSRPLPSEGPAGAATMNVMVTVADEYRERLDQVVHTLEKAGMTVADTFALSGVIVGEVAVPTAGRLHAVPGVASVEEEPVHFAPR